MMLLIGVTAIMPLSMHVILPAIPTVSRAMDAPVPTVQLAVTLFLIVVAFAQLIYGPLSDRYGRKPPLLVGLCIFIAGTLACAGASSIAMLLGGRMLQGLGACSGVVLARAMLRDVYPPDRGAQLQAHMSSIMILLPIVAAMIGGMLVGLIGWRWPFVVLATIGAFLLFRSASIGETHNGPRAAPGVGRMLQDYVALLKLPQFSGSACAISLMTGCLFSFLTQAPQLFEEGLGIPPSRYGFLLAVVPCGWGVGSFLASRIIPRLGSRRVSILGARLVFVTSFGGLASALLLPLSVPALLAPMVLFNISQALTVPGLTMQAISANPNRIGAASGLMGFLMMLGAALATRVVSLVSDGTELPLGMLIATLGSCASILALWGIRHAAAGRATEVR